jgi:hypothetical protein
MKCIAKSFAERQQVVWGYEEHNQGYNERKMTGPYYNTMEQAQARIPSSEMVPSNGWEQLAYKVKAVILTELSVDQILEVFMEFKDK